MSADIGDVTVTTRDLIALVEHSGAQEMSNDRYGDGAIRRRHQRGEQPEMSAAKVAESQVARIVISELQMMGYETYEEVSTGYGSKRADIVAVRGPVVMVVETKTSFSTDLMLQLAQWIGGAHYVVGAALGRCNWVWTDYCKMKGIGLWQVRPDALGRSYDEHLRETLAPRLFRNVSLRAIKDSLCSENKTGGEYARAGSYGGKYYTPFQATCRNLVQVVNRNPGLSMRDALKETKHHYASTQSALSALPRLIRQGVIPEIRVDDGRPLRLYPTTTTSNAGARP